jgi:hypothetical protein
MYCDETSKIAIVAIDDIRDNFDELKDDLYLKLPKFLARPKYKRMAKADKLVCSELFSGFRKSEPQHKQARRYMTMELFQCTRLGAFKKYKTSRVCGTQQDLWKWGKRNQHTDLYEVVDKFIGRFQNAGETFWIRCVDCRIGIDADPFELHKEELGFILAIIGTKFNYPESKMDELTGKTLCRLK